jgi:hypothetical protein
LRRILSVGLPGVLTVVLATLAGPARAADDAPDTPCQAQIFVNLDPGVSLQPSSGTFASNGQDGQVACTGPINGRSTVAGGAGGATGRYGVDEPNTCYQLKGKTVFTITATLPAGTKPILFSDTVTGEYGPLENNWFFGGTFKGPHSYGTFKFTPVDSDCAVRPVKKLFVNAQAWVINGAPDKDMATRMATVQ